jgi:hypothetical protein
LGFVTTGDLARDHRWAQLAFGQVVGGINAVVTAKDKDSIHLSGSIPRLIPPERPLRFQWSNPEAFSTRGNEPEGWDAFCWSGFYRIALLETGASGISPICAFWRVRIASVAFIEIRPIKSFHIFL